MAVTGLLLDSDNLLRRASFVRAPRLRPVPPVTPAAGVVAT